MNTLREMGIVECENVFLQKIRSARNQDRRVFILGAGSGGRVLLSGIKDNGLDIDAFLIEKGYSKPSDAYGKTVYYISDLIKKDENPLILISIRNYDIESIQKRYNRAEFLYEDLMSFWSIDSRIMSTDYIGENINLFSQTYNWLCDTKSRECFSAYINQKISGKFDYLDKLWIKEQYYVDEIVRFNEINSFVDCGAYNGDSYIEFLRAYESHMHEQYVGKAFLFEADNRNFELLEKNTSKDHRAISYNLGVSDKEDILFFNNGNTTSSRLSDRGVNEIRCNSIDNLLSDQHVGFIKMDIEGSELAGIRGAKSVIQREHPQLAICVYHKIDDLITIPQEIKQMWDGYKIFLRAHKPWSQEIVLYAVP